VLRVGEFNVCLWECVCAVCWTDLFGIVGVSMCCVWDSLVWDWSSEYVLCVG